MIIDKDFLSDLRRNAYIECTENYLAHDNVVGIFGDELPEEIFYGCSLIPVPLEGVDSHIFRFGKQDKGKDLCDVIKSTLIYLTTQKCPILYSCKTYVTENKCQLLYNTLKENTEKPVIIYENEKQLKQALCKIYNTQYSENKTQKAKNDLDCIKNILTEIELYSDLNTEEVFLLTFYSKYMTDLSMRKKYFKSLKQKINFRNEKKKIQKISALCPRGNYKSVCSGINSNSARLYRSWDNSDYGYANCIFNFKNEKNYEEENKNASF